MPLTSFNKYINGTDPQTPIETYYYMQGLDGNQDGAPLIDPTTGEVTLYALSGDPVTGTGWIDADPADRRYMCNSGPFTFEPGEVQEVVVAIVCARGSNNLDSVTQLKLTDDTAQKVFDLDFNVPSAPDQPIVTAHTFEDQKIILTWEDGSEDYPLEKHNVPWSDILNSWEYVFEGYIVYQGESQTGPWEPIATYDVADNDIKILWDYETVAGSEYNQWGPVIYGSDSGIQYQIEIDKDYINNTPLRNATPYYFAVTAYARFAGYDGETEESIVYLPIAPFILESSLKPLTVIPTNVQAGDDYSSVQGWEEDTEIDIIYHQENLSLKKTDDVITVQVIDPTLTTGHNYELFWTAVDTSEFGGYPTTPTATPQTYKYTWSLLDTDTDELVLENMWNKFGDSRYPIVDGIQVKVIGGYTTTLLERPAEEWWFDTDEIANGVAVEGVFQGSSRITR